MILGSHKMWNVLPMTMLHRNMAGFRCIIIFNQSINKLGYVVFILEFKECDILRPLKSLPLVGPH